MVELRLARASDGNDILRGQEGDDNDRGAFYTAMLGGQLDNELYGGPGEDGMEGEGVPTSTSAAPTTTASMLRGRRVRERKTWWTVGVTLTRLSCAT